LNRVVHPLEFGFLKGGRVADLDGAGAGWVPLDKSEGVVKAQDS